jgi:2-oxo-4-hydroxy-4-carboxy-5-ureidoimidazoline decarboxylase
MTKTPLDVINAADRDAFLAALGTVFEHSPWVAEAVMAQRPFASLAALAGAMEAALRAAAGEQQLALLQAHPDLAGAAARAGTLTQFSTAEQQAAGLVNLSAADSARFVKLNAAYRARFGFPFIVCARRHAKDSILRAFERRLGNDADAERAAALDEVLRIARLRLDGLVAAPDRLKVHGRLSTHVLDTARGRPAGGMALELAQLAADGTRLTLVRTTTNADGRTDAPLIADRPLPIATYELVFDVAGYFAAAGVPLADPPFIAQVPLRFAIAEPEGHYHVPLLVSPWSYSTYRGS